MTDLAAELTPLLSRVLAEMAKEPGAQLLRPEVLAALAVRAVTAAGVYVGNPLTGHHCNSCDGHSRPDNC